MSVYPRPATKKVFVKIAEFESHNNIKINIYDMNGRIIRKSDIITEIQTIAVFNLESGIYNFNIVSDNGTTNK